MNVHRIVRTAVILLAAVPWGQTGVRPGADQGPITPTAVLAGQAVDAVTGAPVPHTVIGLSQRTGAGPNTTPVMPKTQLIRILADDQGRFVIRDVPKGSFLLLATAPGYIVSNYGQSRATGPTRTIDLTGSEHLVDIRIPLWRHAVISGTVRDEVGEPVVGATVRVLRRMPNGPGGYVRYQPGTQTTTDDRGQYRLTALTPGQFLVTVPRTQITVPANVVDGFLQSVSSRDAGAGAELVDAMSSSSALPSAGDGLRVGDLLLQSSSAGRVLPVPPPAGGAIFVYPMTTYAGDSGSSAAISVGPGEERRGIDIQLKPAGAVRIDGRVVTGGAPAGNVSVRLVHATGEPIQNDNGFEAGATVTTADGSFTLLGIAPGSYRLKVLRTPRVTLPAGLAANPAIVAAYGADDSAVPTGGSAPLVGAQVTLTIGSDDVRDLVVDLRPGATVSGRLEFSGGVPTAQQMQSFAALISSEDGGLPGAPLQLARVSADGTFTATAPAPGRYMVTVLGPPAAGWQRAGLTVGGRPLAGLIDLSGEDVTDVVIPFTKEVATLAGTARRSDGAAMGTAEIVIFAADRTMWRSDPIDPYQPRIEQTPRGGAFTVTGLLPGDYLVAAIDEADVPELTDADFFERVSRVATRVTLTAGRTSTQSLIVQRLR